MLYSHAWLEALVPHGKTAADIASLIGRHVATVDDMRQLRSDLASFVVARVVEAKPHPNSDHLWVTKVDDGSGTLLDVVCGAPNVTEGTLYPFARTGTVMPGGLTIEKRKIRGETSNGMLCSARELGLGEEHNGILALTVDVPPGTPLLSAMPLGDVQLDVDVLPNRPDLLSHVGMAREIGALTGTSVLPLSELAGRECGVSADRLSLRGPVRGEREATSAGVTVRIDDPALCSRYAAVVMRGVAVKPSPDWLVQRLTSIGLRPISNIVDVTNYVLHTVGQPMHAFDAHKLRGATVIVRGARANETLTTLDGTSRALPAGAPVIADADGAIAVAGVMGGRDSEVTDATTSILLEVACFDPRAVRVARRALNLSTDASYRFERGIDRQAIPDALAFAVMLLQAVAGGEVVEAPLLVGSDIAPNATLSLRASRVSRLLGDTVSRDEVGEWLGKIGFTCEAVTADELRVTAPSWRHDVSRDVDLVEEIARLRGFDRLSDSLAAFRPGTVPDHPLAVTGRRVRDLLVGRGLHEVRPLPFVAGRDETHPRVANPLAEDEPHLRRSILETLARRAEYNLSRMQGNVRLFEIGSTFERATDANTLPTETVCVGVLVMGAQRPPHFTEPNPPQFDEWDAKAIATALGECAYPGQRVSLDAGEGDLLWSIGVDGQAMGRVIRLALDKPVWASPAFGVELALGGMANSPVAAPKSHAYVPPAVARLASHAYRPLPTTPAAEFDLALLVPLTVSAAQCEEVLRRSGGELLESVVLFDEFRGKGIPEGVRSLGWRLTFRDPKRTLRDKEVEGRRAKILQTMERELGVRPRSL